MYDYKKKLQDKLDNMRKQIEDDSIPLYKRNQLVYKVWKLRNKLHPKKFWDSKEKGIYRKKVNNGTK